MTVSPSSRIATLGAAVVLVTVVTGLTAQTGSGTSSPEGSERRFPIDPNTAPRPSLRAVRAPGPIVLDGHLDEPAWGAATAARDFIQSFPEAGYPASQSTEVRVLYDEENLYFGATLFDSELAGMIRKGLRRDFASTEDDIFGVALDTFLDRRNAFYFFINPNGAIRDSQAFDNSRISGTEWDGVIHVRTAILESGWSVEVAVPFSTLRFDPGRPDQTWGIQFLRRVRRDNEDAHWAPIDRRSQIHRMDLAGTLVGLPSIRGGRNLTVKPYSKIEHVGGTLDATGSDRPFDGGLDVKYGITPRLTLDATWRTDFSQVEVDQQQVNLTRFSLFFPEKRGFFIENAGTFAFGDISERNYRLGASPRDFSLFHSRRIGLDGGVPVPIQAGARITGRAAGLEVGLLTMQTEGGEARAPENFAVARVRGGVAGRADVGGILVNRQATDGSGGYNRSWGVDANLRFLDNLLVHSYLAGTDEPGTTGDPHAGRVSAAWRDQLWDASVLFRRVGDSFDPGVGFVQRTGIRHHYATLGAHPRPPLPHVSELNPYVEADYITDLGGSLETRAVTGAVDVHMLDGGTLSLSGTSHFERLDESFGVLGGMVPAGRYRFGVWNGAYSSDASRPVSGRVRVGRGGYYQGQRQSLSLGLLWKPSSHWALDLSFEHNALELEEESFSAGVFGGRLTYDHSTTLFGSAFVQYNDDAREVVSNVRLNWVHAPLSDVFLVYTERRSTTGAGVLDRRVTLKVTKLLQL